MERGGREARERGDGFDDSRLQQTTPEVMCDWGMRASRLMTPKFERYFACPKWKWKFDKKLEVVTAENAVRWEMKATMR
ncbi:hypothetical protein LINGRAHAP2_LOCUS25314, partial [Linum grandiflorum]